MKEEEFEHVDEEAIIYLIIILCTRLREIQYTYTKS
jgi:hypothetical protein